MEKAEKRAWETLEKLSFERVTGTMDEFRAAQLIKAECEKAGVPAVLESYEIEMPRIDEVSLEIVGDTPKSYQVIGIGKSGITPPEGIEAPFIYIENALESQLTDVDGKICLISGRMKSKTVERLVKAGALGYITIHGSFYDEPEMVAELRPRNMRDSEGMLPGVVIHIQDAEDLVRRCPKKVRLVLRQDMKVKGTAQNVVATIEGSDPKLKNEVVTFSAHYDSVRYSSGAWDNATGSVTVLELLHYYRENKPKRTVTFIWCGSEEIGLVGSKAYCKKHEAELKNHILNINFDMTGVTLGYEYFCCSANEELLHIVNYLAQLEGYAVESKMDLYASDSTSFALAGVPSCTFARLQCPGGATIHNRHDNLAHLDAKSMMKTLNFVIHFSYQIIMAPVNVVPRHFASAIQNKIDERKKKMGK